MKYQIVKRILGISLAVCTVYGSVRGAYATISGAYATVESDNAVVNSDVIATSDDYTSSAAPTATFVAEAEIKAGYTLEEYDEGTATAEKEEKRPGAIAESKQQELSETLVGPEVVTEDPEEALTEAESEDPEEILTEPEPEEPEITLEEYLSNLRCGACGRCCSLLHPHCRNGKHKAQSAEQEYYETYAISEIHYLSESLHYAEVTMPLSI